MNRLMFAYRCLALLLLAACSRAEPAASRDSAKPAVADAPPASPAPPASAESLTSSYGRPHPGSWEPTSEYADSLYTFRYPSSAHVEKKPPRGGIEEVSVSQLPDCLWPCYVTVSVQRDTSALPLETAIREETTADTSGGSEAADEVASIRDSLPLGTARAVHLETYCGDCTSGELVTAHGPWLARIEYDLDDRDGHNERLLAHLVEIARTFRWREEGPSARPHDLAGDAK